MLFFPNHFPLAHVCVDGVRLWPKQFEWWHQAPPVQQPKQHPKAHPSKTTCKNPTMAPITYTPTKYSAPETTPKDPSVAPTTSLMKSENPKCDTSARHRLTKCWKPKKRRLVLKKLILNLESKNFYPKPIRNAEKHSPWKIVWAPQKPILKRSYKKQIWI